MDKKISEIFDYGDGIVVVEERDDLFDPARIKELTMQKINDADKNTGNKNPLKKARPVYRTLLIAAVVVVLLIGTALAISRLTAHADEPILGYYMEYIAGGGAAAEDAGDWSKYVYFPDDAARAAAEAAFVPASRSFIQASEKLSDDLWAFTAYYMFAQDGDGYSVVQFCGRFNGRLYVFLDEESVPDALREGLENLTLTPIESDDLTDSLIRQEEAQELLIPFCDPDARVEIFLPEDYNADASAEPKVLDDYLIDLSNWMFEDGGEAAPDDPEAAIKIYDAEGNALWIIAGADALLIEKTDGSILRAVYEPGGLDTADMIAHLLPWARGEYSMLDRLEDAQAEASSETQIALELLGDHGPAGKEQYQYNVVGEADALTLYAVMNGFPEIYAATLTKDYSFNTGSDTGEYWELHYERYWTDETRAECVTADVFDEMRGMLRMLYGTYREDLSVSGQETLAYNMMGQQVILWYDAEHDLIFSLLCYADASGEMDESLLDKMLALAETVE